MLKTFLISKKKKKKYDFSGVDFNGSMKMVFIKIVVRVMILMV